LGLTLVAVAATVLASLALAACGSGGSDSTSSTEATGTTASSDSSHEGKSIAIVMPESVPGYAKQIGCGAFEEGQNLGFDVGQPQGPTQGQNAAEQQQILQSVLATDPDGLVFSAVDPTAGGNAIKPAVEEGLPVVAVDVELTDPSLAISFVSSSHEEGGELGGELLAKQIGESGEVIGIGVIPDNPITIGRITGFENAMEKYPEIEVVGVKYPAFDVNAIAAETSALLAQHPDLKGIYTTNDTIAAGVATALRQAQKVGQVKVITWDLQPVGIKLLQEGVVTGSVVQDPREEGRMAVQQLANEFDGKPVQKMIKGPLKTIENTEIDDPAVKKMYYSNSC